MRKRRWFALAAVALGLALAAAALEIGLRVEGRRRHAAVDAAVDATGSAAREDTVIVCTGDSHTKGIGAPEGLDYPSQLGRLLAERDPSRRFVVHNLGFPGNNSSQSVDAVLERLPRLERAPDVVILNAGKNNPHNFTNARILPEEARSLSPDVWINYLARNSRALRFGVVTARRLEHLHKSPVEYADLRWDLVLDMHGRRERAFVAEWISRDIDALREALADGPARVFYLNYWDRGTEWADAACEQAAAEGRAACVDVRDFGRPGLDPTPYVVVDDWHANQDGYRLIAELVRDALVEADALPAPPGDE